MIIFHFGGLNFAPTMLPSIYVDISKLLVIRKKQILFQCTTEMVRKQYQVSLLLIYSSVLKELNFKKFSFFFEECYLSINGTFILVILVFINTLQSLVIFQRQVVCYLISQAFNRIRKWDQWKFTSTNYKLFDC